MAADLQRNRRILLIDDNEAIHRDFRKILAPALEADAVLAEAADALFGEKASGPAQTIFELESAFQGQEGLEKVRTACLHQRPYALAFVDVRMPPGWDGIETIFHIWKEYPDLQVVICTAYSDYSLDQIVAKLGVTDRMVILKKPFDPIEVVQLAHALTEKWELLQKSRAQVDELERRVAERTRQLEERQEQLMEARQLELTGKLAGGIAHDFNTLLTTVIGHADLIRHSVPAESPLFRSAVEIGQAADRAATLTRQLLAFSRKQRLRPELLNINQVLQEISPILRRLVGGSIAVLTVAQAQHPWVNADLAQIQQVLVSLALNARDAMPAGGQLTLTAQTETFDENYAAEHLEVTPGEYVTISVTDTGEGIAEEVLPRLFEPFFTTKSQGEGTGLGLAMCYGILKQSHGHIGVQSHLGQGATFNLYLPTVRTPSVAVVEPRLPASALPEGKQVILLVQEDAALLSLATLVLERAGYTVFPAGSATEALTVAEQMHERLDLLLTDLIIARMNGRELIERLRVSHPEMKVLYTFTSAVGAPARGDLVEPGGLFLQKPFTPQALAEKAREALELRPDQATGSSKGLRPPDAPD